MYIQFNKVKSNMDSLKSQTSRTHFISPALFLFILTLKITLLYEKFGDLTRILLTICVHFTNKKKINSTEKLDQTTMFVVIYHVDLATIEPKHRLNSVNTLDQLSRPSADVPTSF